MQKEPVSYEKFTTGFTFKDVYWMIKNKADKKFERIGEYTFITRHTILGYWKELKEIMYFEYLNNFYK